MSDIRELYRQRYEKALTTLAPRLEAHIREIFDGVPRIDRVSARPKSIDRFVQKANKEVSGHQKYSEPLVQIQDQLAARVIAFYRADVDEAADLIQKYFTPIETRDLVPESEWEFGYFGRHFVLVTPSDILGGGVDRSDAPEFFELQIKTLFQHAWSEANHDLGYKEISGELPPDAYRRLAFTSAQAWGADRIFQELFSEATASSGSS
jgi:putative GTP pyrophosphokinase